MKKITVLSIWMLALTLAAHAYEVGGKAKSNFGPAAAEQTETETTTPQYRSFSNYSSRNGNKGVQTNRVQTNLAGQQVTQFKPLEPQPETAVQQAVTKKAAAADEKKATTGARTTDAAGAANPTAAQNAAQPAAGTPDMAQAQAAIQQLQSLQNMMKNMNGAAGGAAAGATGAAGSAAAGQKQAPGAGMPNIPGMPDMSSLLKGAGAPASGGK